MLASCPHNTFYSNKPGPSVQNYPKILDQLSSKKQSHQEHESAKMPKTVLARTLAQSTLVAGVFLGQAANTQAKHLFCLRLSIDFYHRQRPEPQGHNHFVCRIGGRLGFGVRETWAPIPSFLLSGSVTWAVTYRLSSSL